MKYRKEIDGLRAVAVLPVVLFHAGFEIFSGGFVGVDVFFVISGYLITTIILSEMERGTFSLLNFYERRARRILPALFFVMFACLPFAWVWLSPSDMEDFSQSLGAVSIFASNFLFWHEAGYWDAANELKPLLHTWSLAVEEQYYILFPPFLIVMWRYRKRWILGSFMAMAAVSLVASEWGSTNIPVANFYLLPTRAWELAIGASIAFFFLYRKRQMGVFLSSKISAEVLGLVGIVMIGYSVFTLDETVPFPGFHALVPTIGTGLVIVFSSAQTVVGRLLGMSLLVKTGLVSYSAYLWHYPIFAFARHRSLTEPSDFLFAVLAVFSFLLAYISWRFVERPFRKKGVFDRKTIFVFAFVGSVFFIAIALPGHLNFGWPGRMDAALIKALPEVNEGIRCVNKQFQSEKICELVNSPDKLTYLVGDSHARAIAHEMQVSLAEKKVGTPTLLGLDDVVVADDLGCSQAKHRDDAGVVDRRRDTTDVVDLDVRSAGREDCVDRRSKVGLELLPGVQRRGSHGGAEQYRRRDHVRGVTSVNRAKNELHVGADGGSRHEARHFAHDACCETDGVDRQFGSRRVSAWSADRDRHHVGCRRDRTAAKRDAPCVELWLAMQPDHGSCVVEAAVGEHVECAARDALLGGLEDEPHAVSSESRVFGEEQGRSDSDRGVDVVPAGMADPVCRAAVRNVLEVVHGECVDVGADSDHRAQGGAWARGVGDHAGPHRHRPAPVSGAADQVGDHPGRAVFVAAQLRVSMEVSTNLDEAVVMCVEPSIQRVCEWVDGAVGLACHRVIG